MTRLTDPIRIETVMFPVHQVSHKIPQCLNSAKWSRSLDGRHFRSAFLLARLACLMLLVNQVTRERVTMFLVRGGAC